MNGPAGELEIWMVAAELAPLASTGGLGEVLRSLPLALAQAGASVRRILPAYGGVDRSGFEPDGPTLRLPSGGDLLEVSFSSRRDARGVRTTLVNCGPLFDRPGVYGAGDGDHADNPRRFAMLAQAAVALAGHVERPPDVLHAHDWHAALVPVFVRHAWPAATRPPSTVLTVHNIGYAGRFGAESLRWLGLPAEVAARLFQPDGLEFWGDVSFLKGGLVFADRIATVSPTHREEILREETGFGLHGILQARQDDLVGILNGVDYGTWNPAADPHLPLAYDASTVAAGKRAAQARLRRELGLAPASRVVLSVVSRLAHQKGIDVLLEAIGGLLDLQLDVAILGSGEPLLEARLRDAVQAFPGRVGVRLGYDHGLAHLLMGGTDLLAVPSRYEPCGLVQLQALRYGAVPVVHAVGGLLDTVRDADATRSGTGFTFTPLTPASLVRAVARALAVHEDGEAWTALVRRGMGERFDWGPPAEAYVAIYRGLRSAATRALSV